MKAYVILLISIFMTTISCDKFSPNIFKRSKRINQDIQDCDNTSDYYEEGTHYIRRDLVTDGKYSGNQELATEYNVMDYEKLLDSYDLRNSDCNPYSFKENEIPKVDWYDKKKH